MKSVKVPFIHYCNKIGPLVVDRLKVSQMESLWEIIKYNSTKGHSGADEFPSKDYLEQYLFQKTVSYSVMKEHSESLLAMVSIYPSALTRTTFPFLHGGYMHIHPDYTKQGIGPHLYLLMAKLGRLSGYYGILSWASLKNSSFNCAVRQVTRGERKYVGAIPGSLGFVKNGTKNYVDDLIHFQDYKLGLDKISMDSTAINFGGYSLLNTFPKSTGSSWTRHSVSFSTQIHGVGKVTVDKFRDTKEAVVDKLIKAAAEQGDGFGQDEFTPDGAHNRKLFKSDVTLVAKTGKQTLLGGIILGPSALCRTKEMKYMGFYIIVDPKHRNKGIGTHLARECCDLGCRLGFGGILCDVLMSNSQGLNLAQSLGMHPVAILPYCCFVQGKGYVDSIVFVKKFKEK